MTPNPDRRNPRRENMTNRIATYEPKWIAWLLEQRLITRQESRDATIRISADFLRRLRLRRRQ
jgi:hypothetical protein